MRISLSSRFDVLDQVEAATAGQRKVDDCKIRAVGVDLFEGLGHITGFTAQTSRSGQSPISCAKPGAHQGMVVDYQYSCHKLPC